MEKIGNNESWRDRLNSLPDLKIDTQSQPKQEFAKGLKQLPMVKQPTPKKAQQDPFVSTAKATGAHMLNSFVGQPIEDIGQVSGLPSIQNAGKSVRQYAEQVQKENPSQINSLGEIVEKPVTAIKSALGNVLPQLPVSMAGAYAGSKAGLALPLPPQGKAIAGLVGGIGGAFLPNYFQEAAEMRGKQHESGQEDMGKAYGMAVPAAALETVGDVVGMGLGKFVPKGTLPAVGDALIGNTNRFAHAAKQAAKGAVIEGPLTEYPQTYLEQVGGNQATDTPEAQNEREVSAGLAALGGGTISGIRSTFDKRQLPPITQSPANQTVQEPPYTPQTGAGENLGSNAGADFANVDTGQQEPPIVVNPQGQATVAPEGPTQRAVKTVGLGSQPVDVPLQTFPIPKDLGEDREVTYKSGQKTTVQSIFDSMMRRYNGDVEAAKKSTQQQLDKFILPEEDNANPYAGILNPNSQPTGNADQAATGGEPRATPSIEIGAGGNDAGRTTGNAGQPADITNPEPVSGVTSGTLTPTGETENGKTTQSTTDEADAERERQARLLDTAKKTDDFLTAVDNQADTNISLDEAAKINGVPVSKSSTPDSIIEGIRTAHEQNKQQIEDAGSNAKRADDVGNKTGSEQAGVKPDNGSKNADESGKGIAQPTENDRPNAARPTENKNPEFTPTHVTSAGDYVQHVEGNVYKDSSDKETEDDYARKLTNAEKQDYAKNPTPITENPQASVGKEKPAEVKAGNSVSQPAVARPGGVLNEQPAIPDSTKLVPTKPQQTSGQIPAGIDQGHHQSAVETTDKAFPDAKYDTKRADIGGQSVRQYVQAKTTYDAPVTSKPKGQPFPKYIKDYANAFHANLVGARKGVESDTFKAIESDGIKQSTEKRQGKVGDKFSAGESVLTASGRETTPFPEFTVKSGKNKGKLSTAGVKNVDLWLIENAIEEAKTRGDDFNQRQFEANKNKPSQADKDSAEEYLFGEQPDVPRPFPKPLVTNTGSSNDNKVKTALPDKADTGAIKETPELEAAREQSVNNAGNTQAQPVSDGSEEENPLTTNLFSFQNTPVIDGKAAHPFTEYDAKAKEYGRSVNPDGEIISSKGKPTGIKLEVKKGRLRFVGNGKLVSSGSPNPETLEAFLKKYWFDEKLKPQPAEETKTKEQAQSVDANQANTQPSDNKDFVSESKSNKNTPPEHLVKLFESHTKYDPFPDEKLAGVKEAERVQYVQRHFIDIMAKLTIDNKVQVNGC